MTPQRSAPRGGLHLLLLSRLSAPLLCLLLSVAAAVVADESTAHLRVLMYSWSNEWGQRAPDRFRECAQGQLLCETTWNASRMVDASAFLFHPPDEPEGALPTELVDDPLHRPLYYRTDEAPPPYATPEFLQRFDLVSTYDLLSDAPRPYFINPDLLRSMRSKGEAAMKEGWLEAQVALVEAKVQWARLHHRAPIAWFVSNCGSGRSLYVAELMRHVPVDVYSSPQSRCLGTNLTLPSRFEANATAIEDDLLSSHYPFYLALENRNCRDYATEKLYRPLTCGVVPIVDGPYDYSPFLPTSDAALQLDDYASPAQLAAHVSYLLHHPAEYAQRLNFSSLSPAFVQATDFNYDGTCQLCEHAYRAKMHIQASGRYERFTTRYRYGLEQMCHLHKWERFRTPETTTAASSDSHLYAGPRISAEQWWDQWGRDASPASFGPGDFLGRAEAPALRSEPFAPPPPLCEAREETTWSAVVLVGAVECLLLLVLFVRWCPRRLLATGLRGGRTDLHSPLRSLHSLGRKT